MDSECKVFNLVVEDFTFEGIRGLKAALYTYLASFFVFNLSQQNVTEHVESFLLRFLFNYDSLTLKLPVNNFLTAVREEL